MNDKPQETKRIEALFGPLAGSIMDIPTADADAAISDGWARDPFATPSAEDEQKQKEWSAETHEKVIEAAEKAARKIRGEEDDLKARKGSGNKKAADKSEDTNADTQAAVGKAREAQVEAKPGDDDQGYETRAPRGRPTTTKK